MYTQGRITFQNFNRRIFKTAILSHSTKTVKRKEGAKHKRPAEQYQQPKKICIFC